MSGLGSEARVWLLFGLPPQDSSHVGNSGVGVVSMRGAPVALPSCATAQFRRFFDCGRAIRCLLPLGLGRFMHLVVLYGYQDADTDAELLTEQLFGAALGELGEGARDQPCLLVGDFNVEPTKIPCLSEGISAGSGLTWMLHSLLPPVSVVGSRLVVSGEIFWLVALL